ncbi:7-cyano-7-deazaguanine synthase [Corallococcus sp. AB030]|uniref:7-cyano-7-deazaguanine synthase n=1 Tax=Corallococcus sp. AB030 TaxID=2316716 RepID=UPI000ECA0077|nr:7-cyano-7-deazaguanine synthase [Corallococcus sp. AB030]RKI09816.1 7-cyano-7-deazaguanine synthase [Corallococcus sp. AB030]
MNPPHQAPVALLASGGLDSTVLAYWLSSKGFDVYPIFIDYGQHCAKIELQTAKTVLPPTIRDRIEVLHLGDVFSSSKSLLISETNLWEREVSADELILPYRNLFFLVSGCARAATLGLRHLYSAFINSNHAAEIDAGRAFLDGVHKLTLGVGGVSIEMPFRDMSKTEVAQLGISLSAPVAHTYSCQANSASHCGACPNCVDRLTALQAIHET